MTGISILSSLVCAEFQTKFKDERATEAMHIKLKLHHKYGDDVPEDYYPYAELLIWSPTNYTRVYVRESDPHHYGSGPWVMIYDHDGGWREGVEEFFETYASEAFSIGRFGEWYAREDVSGWDLPTEWGNIDDAAHLPHLRVRWGNTQ